MKMYNIPLATANRGILTKQYILFVLLEGNTSFFLLLLLFFNVDTCKVFASWEVRIKLKTVIEVLKMLPKATGGGQHFQVRAHSFSLHRPTPSR